MFAWANRLMLTLGEPEPEAAESQEFLIAPS